MADLGQHSQSVRKPFPLAANRRLSARPFSKTELSRYRRRCSRTLPRVRASRLHIVSGALELGELSCLALFWAPAWCSRGPRPQHRGHDSNDSQRLGMRLLRSRYRKEAQAIPGHSRRCGKSPFARSVGLAASALIASSATLVCCVPPATLVALGAGAALAGLVTAVPQLIWLSEHKPLVFGIASAMLLLSGAALWVGRRAPCPTDPALASSCMRLRRWSALLYAVALVSYGLGATFAFLLPVLVFLPHSAHF
jgi:hypothetical protein